MVHSKREELTEAVLSSVRASAPRPARIHGPSASTALNPEYCQSLIKKSVYVWMMYCTFQSFCGNVFPKTDLSGSVILLSPLGRES